MTFKIEKSEQSYPLHWPMGQERTHRPTQSKFRTTFSSARNRLVNELKLLKADNVILSTNIPLKNDGLPYASFKIDDSGVAVYFTYKNKPMVFACDRWRTPQDNIYAIALTIGALRGIDRWGSGDMLERSFMGFQALPAPEGYSANVVPQLAKQKEWFEVLEIDPGMVKSCRNNKEIWRDEMLRVLKEKRLMLSKAYHPDVNPNVDPDMMSKINQAYEEGCKEFKK